jgi:hypothetical protein
MAESSKPKMNKGDIAGIGAGVLLAGLSQISKLKPVRVGGLIAGLGLSGYGYYSYLKRVKEERDLNEKSGNDPAVAQAQKLNNVLNGWWGFYIPDNEIISVAAEITCWEAVKAHYQTITGRFVETDLEKLSVSERKLFDDALLRANKHLGCKKDEKGRITTDTDKKKPLELPINAYLSGKVTGLARYAPRPDENFFTTFNPKKTTIDADGFGVFNYAFFSPSQYVGRKIKEVRDSDGTAWSLIKTKRSDLGENRDIYFWAANSNLRLYEKGDSTKWDTRSWKGIVSAQKIIER